MKNFNFGVFAFRRAALSISAPLLALAAAQLFTGCSSAPVAKNEVKGDSMREYTVEKQNLEKTNIVAPGFLLRVHHSADEQISGEFRVNFKGELKLPYKVNVLAAGLTTDELAQKLQRAYGSFFKVHNTVSVEIAARDYLIEVRGLVKKPGILTVKLDTSIEEVIALAGGMVTPGGEGKSEGGGGVTKPEYIRLVRPDFANQGNQGGVRWIRLSDYFLRYDVRNEVLWRGGEQLFFQVTGDQNAARNKSQTVQVMGEVRQPGEYALQPNTDLYTYIAQAGGPTSSADLGSVTVIHKADNDSSTYDLSHSTAMVDLGPGDLIVLKSAITKPGFVERFGPLIISIGSLAVTIIIAVVAL